MIKLEDVVYSAILLSQECNIKLKDYTKSIFQFLGSSTLYCNHVTLAFEQDVTSEHIRNVGVAVKALVPTELLIGTNGAAGLFFDRHQLDIRGIPFAGKYPHLSLLCPAMMPPKEIGFLPDLEHFHFPVDHRLAIDGVVSAFMKDGSWQS